MLEVIYQRQLEVEGPKIQHDLILTRKKKTQISISDSMISSIQVTTLLGPMRKYLARNQKDELVLLIHHFVKLQIPDYGTQFTCL